MDENKKLKELREWCEELREWCEAGIRIVDGEIRREFYDFDTPSGAIYAVIDKIDELLGETDEREQEPQRGTEQAIAEVNKWREQRDKYFIKLQKIDKLAALAASRDDFHNNQRSGPMTTRDQNIELLRKWDNGELIRTIEMGGLGPGYEQCIQILAVEMLRDLEATDTRQLSPEEYKDKLEKLTDLTVARLDKTYHFSGAQVGAARSLAVRAYYMGWQSMLDEVKAQGVEQDRFISASKDFPRGEK